MGKSNLVHHSIQKIASGIFSLLMAILTTAVVPRSLGVEKFGIYSLCILFNAQLLQFLEIRSSTYIFTRISSDPKTRYLYRYYGSFLAALFPIYAIIIIILHSFGYGEELWHNQDPFIIGSCAVFSFFLWLNTTSSSLLDACERTGTNEIIRIGTKALISLGLVGAAAYSSLTIIKVSWIQTLCLLASTGLIWFTLLSKSANHHQEVHDSKESHLAFFSSLFAYCAPLIGYMALSSITTFSIRWILGHFYGAFELGLFSFSYQIMGLGYAVIGVLMPLLTRELSKSNIRSSPLRIRSTIGRFLAAIQSTLAPICMILSLHSDLICGIFGGPSYARSALPLAILLLYPITSSFSGIHASLTFSAGKTKAFFVYSLAITPFHLGLFYLLSMAHPTTNGATILAGWLVAFDLIGVLAMSRILKRSGSLGWNDLFLRMAKLTFLYFLLLIPSLLLRNIMKIHSEILSIPICILISIFLFIRFPEFFGVSQIRRRSAWMKIQDLLRFRKVSSAS